ncbi:restriction endonuclease [Paenibacillus sp. GCM10027628]|uniref:restriction endonuclease n=1 Tax=Paenibacillus sp. GCM10027628 TaxID=3273413 RepID=UPI003628BDB9
MSERKVWFITRPERDPRFHADAMEALASATKQFTIPWSGNRDAHIEYEKCLYRIGIKRENVSKDGSGGRTWAAMMRTFAYCYLDADGFLQPTKSGLKLLKRDSVRLHTTKQILTLQIPNAYFLEVGFKPKFEEGFRIRPARFLLKLVNQERLDYYVTKEEITFFVLTAKRDDELESAIKRILQFRLSSDEGKFALKAAIVEQFDHRERSDKGARDFEIAHSDVAHTFMLICEYTELAEYIRGKALRVDPSKSVEYKKRLEEFDERYPFNERYKISLEQMALHNGLDIGSYKANHYGSIGAASNSKKTEILINRLLNDVPNPSALSVESLTEILSSEFPRKDAEMIAFNISQTIFTEVRPEFVDSYLNQEDDRMFEDQTGNVLRALGFEVVMRPKPKAKASTEIEILVKYGTEFFGILDSKNYRPKFPLSANLVSHMASEYIPNYEGFEGRKVGFFGYVTAQGFSGESNLRKISDLVKRTISDRDIPGIMLTAQSLLAFLNYCMEENLPEEKRVRLFLDAVCNQGYSTPEQLLKKVRSFSGAH